MANITIRSTVVPKGFVDGVGMRDRGNKDDAPSWEQGVAAVPTRAHRTLGRVYDDIQDSRGEVWKFLTRCQ